MSSFFKNKLKDILGPLIVAAFLTALVIYSASQKEASFIDSSPQSVPVSSGEVFVGSFSQTGAEPPEFLLFQDNTFRATYPPFTITPKVLGDLVGGMGFEQENVITEYTVEKGDNLWLLADKFEISIESILWANDLSQNSVIRTGQKLIIPPVSGVIHHVGKGDTVSEIAQKYEADTEEILSFNNLSGEGDIYIGDILVVPGGEMPPPAKRSIQELTPLANSYFICPIALPCQITQGLHWYNAIDFSHGKCGEPIYAAAGGTVLKVKLTQSTSPYAFQGAGNHITILHPNGVVTMYGHISTSLVQPNQKVSQGQMIALMGGQPGTPGAGQSTGCHVHFGVRGARNPFAQ